MEFMQTSVGPLQMKPKEFNSGSTGYFVWGKVLVDGVPHQFSGNLVRIGSKGNTKGGRG